MDRLADETLQLVVNELDDVGPFSQVSKRLRAFSQDPYVRAHYFLARYGRIQALFWALGRGKLITERVLEILIGSGAHLSRYLVQLAIQHYFRSFVHFIKSQWVRTLSLSVFSHFLKLAAAVVGDVPIAKGEDDGTLFSLFVKQSRLPGDTRNIKVESILEILETYKFMPFCDKDPIMAQFPLALAVEPRFLPLAVANGFLMDNRYRDYVFRRMFEQRTRVAGEPTAEILTNIRELCRLDPSMFVSRTVAAEVCMDGIANVPAYTALRALDRLGELKFDLSTLVQDLMKLFLKTRSVTTSTPSAALRHLFSHFPSKDPAVRLVILLTVFTGPISNTPTVATVHSKIQSLKLAPLSRDDLFNLLLSPFVERHSLVGDYASSHMDFKPADIKSLLSSVAIECLSVSCKGNMLKSIVDKYPKLEDTLSSVVTDQYQVTLDSLPASEDEDCERYQSRLCRELRGDDIPVLARGSVEVDSEASEDAEGSMKANSVAPRGEVVTEPVVHAGEVDMIDATVPTSHLGGIGQSTLSTAIRYDELTVSRRRRWATHFPDYTSLLPYPIDTLPVGRWVCHQFGARHPITAVFMTHAVINNPGSVLFQYLSEGVPVTLMHFRILARLGRVIPYTIHHSVENGAEFFTEDADYLCRGDVKPTVKKEVSQLVSPPGRSPRSFPRAGPSTRKRPRRSAAANIVSYAVPSSDDEAIAEDDDLSSSAVPVQNVEPNVSKWIRHLTALNKEEQRKYKEQKKKVENMNSSGERLRFIRNDFMRSLTSTLRDLRKVEGVKLLEQSITDAVHTGFSDSEDEYQDRTRPPKRRRTLAHTSILP